MKCGDDVFVDSLEDRPWTKVSTLEVFSSEIKWPDGSLLFLRMNYVKNVY